MGFLIKYIIILILVLLSCSVVLCDEIIQCQKYCSLFVDGPATFQCERAKGHDGPCGNCEPCEKCEHKSPLITMQEQIDQLKERIAELEKPQDTSTFQWDFSVPLTYSEKVYYCNKCNQKWKRTSSSVIISCCVIHLPGDCCHIDEELIE